MKNKTIIFAYPGATGLLHCGHMRGYCIADFIVKYEKKIGSKIFFPKGIHCTGNSLLKLFNTNREGITKQLELILQKKIRITTPKKLGDLLFKSYQLFWKKLNIEYDKITASTMEPNYQKFIKWQFKKLEEKQLIIKKDYLGTYCKKCGFIQIDQSETEIQEGKNAIKIYFDLIKKEIDQKIFLIPEIWNHFTDKKLENWIEINPGKFIPTDYSNDLQYQLKIKKKTIQKKIDIITEKKPIREYYRPTKKYALLSQKVVCKCGELVWLKIINKQKMINYQDKELQLKTLDYIQSDQFEYYGSESKNYFYNIIKNFPPRACTRKGNWIGTIYPGTKQKIEAISDSTIYPLFYSLKKLKKKGELFDNNFIEKSIKDDNLQYPIELNIAGKEHKTVHFPAYILNHIALFPKNLWPKKILAHDYVLAKPNEKLSKSKGNAPSLTKILDQYTSDTIRLFYAMSGNPFQDIYWDTNLLEIIKNKLKKIKTPQITIKKEWLTELQYQKVNYYFKEYKFREGADLLYNQLINYKHTKKQLVNWINFIYIITPTLSKKIQKNQAIKLKKIQNHPINFTNLISEQIINQLTKDLIKIFYKKKILN